MTCAALSGILVLRPELQALLDLSTCGDVFVGFARGPVSILDPAGISSSCLLDGDPGRRASGGTPVDRPDEIFVGEAPERPQGMPRDCTPSIRAAIPLLDVWNTTSRRLRFQLIVFITHRRTLPRIQTLHTGRHIHSQKEREAIERWRNGRRRRRRLWEPGQSKFSENNGVFEWNRIETKLGMAAVRNVK